MRGENESSSLSGHTNTGKVSRDETIARHVQHRHRTDPESRHWSTSPELPQPEELMAVEPATLPRGPYQGENFDKQAYLEFHYATSRFEGVELSRRAIQEFRERPLKQDSDDFHVYTQVGSLLLTSYSIYLYTAGTCPGLLAC